MTDGKLEVWKKKVGFRFCDGANGFGDGGVCGLELNCDGERNWKVWKCFLFL